VKDITLHIAAAHPLYVSRDEVPEKLIASERAIFEGQVQGKPANVVDKIVAGKLDKFYSTVCLMEQGFIKNPTRPSKSSSRRNFRARREHCYPPLHTLSRGRTDGERSRCFVGRRTGSLTSLEI
jgi:hypothetical protein